MALRAVLITGAAGNIGSTFAHDAAGRYQLRLTDRRAEDLAALEEWGELCPADVTDLDAMKQTCAGIDTVVHLAGDPSPSATWSSVHEANIVGTYNTFVAAKAAGCRRVVFASSIHAVSGYPADVQVRTKDPVNPGDLYGVSKCFGEALARYMAEQEGLASIAVRIGAFQPPSTVQGDAGPAIGAYFVSPRDLCQLLHRCVEASDDVRFAIVHGLSDNHFKRLDLTDTIQLLGYEPADDSMALNDRLREALAPGGRAENLSDPDQRSGLREDL